MPAGKTPEDVACDVYVAFRQGERKFADDVPMWVQLKSAAKSILWNLHARKEGKVTSAQEPGFFEPLMDGRADQAEALESEEFCTALLTGLYADQKVKKSAELTALVQAIESGADGVEELVEQTKLPKERVYELRRQLKPIAESVLKRLKRTENGYEQIESKSCRAVT